MGTIHESSGAPPPADLTERISITHELERRPAPARDFAIEHAAYVELARVLATTPATVLRRLVELAVELCGAGTAGVSLLEAGVSEGAGRFRWIALAGVYASSLGGTVPQGFSPCGECLRRGSLQLYTRPGRVFADLALLSPPIVECLLVPLQLPGAPHGTIWIMTHDDDGPGFTSRDAAILTGLGEVAAGALALHVARRHADEELRATTERVATAAHDLRAALTPALGWTDVLLAGRVTAAHAARAIAGIQASVHRQARIIEALTAPAPSSRT